MSENKIVIIGAGTGGTIVANKLYKKLKKSKVNYSITVIDPTFQNIYQPGYLFTMFGKDKTPKIIKDSRKLLPKKVITIQDFVDKIDTTKKIVKTKNGGNIPYDYLVIATGARLAPEDVDWWDDSFQHFYSPEAAERLRAAIENFEGGKIVISIADIPYKCPPAPIEASMLIDDYFRKKGMRDKVDITYTSPLGRAFSIETTNTKVESYLKEKNINFITMFNTDYVHLNDRVVESLEGEEVEYDLLIMIPPHRGQTFLTDSGIAPGKGWVPIDRETLVVKNQENMYALGDATDLPISKAGSTAHYQAPIIAQNISDQILGREISGKYNGHVQCFFLTEFGKSMFLDFNYNHPPKPAPTRKIWWYFKLLFKPLYFMFVANGRI